jgi:hypothetical protein
MMGFSASGGFANRFAIIHPNCIGAAAKGGVGGMTVSLPNWKDTELKFSWVESGISELETFTGEPFDLQIFFEGLQLIYVGEQDIIEDRTLRSFKSVVHKC